MVEVIDVESIDKVKSMLIQSGDYAFYCDMYFPKNDNVVMGNIVQDESAEWGDQKVQVSLIRPDGIVIHELNPTVTVKDFMFNMQVAAEIEKGKNESMLQTFKTVSPPEDRDYA